MPTVVQVSRSKKIIVLAGNFKQYKECCEELNLLLRDAIYGDTVEKICSIEAGAIITTGTFLEREDAHELYSRALKCLS